MHKDRTKQIEDWANYIKTNPNWKKEHTEFINAQFQKSEEFYNKLKQTKEGREKIIEIFNIKNKKGYPSLFKS